MSMPRQVIAGSTYLVTRRCTQRQFWLRPCTRTNEVVAFCFAWAAELTGVEIHAICVLSNHLHAVVTDPEGQLPEFMRIAHVYVAKCINASYGRWENLWASEPPSAVRLEGERDVLDKISYCLANPVLSGLVRRGREWPGLRSSPRDLAGTSRIVRRPAVFFRTDGTVPERLELRHRRPSIFLHLTDDQLVERVRQAVHERESDARREHALSGRAILGIHALLTQDPGGKPRTPAPHRNIAPRIAAKNKWARAEALRRLRSFLEEYRAAYEQFKIGLRDVIFPFGTYAMRARHAVLVAGTS
ncbi:MAG: hypothetical protein IT371_22215 [Deltaproteobacteria bacterium]|nr:hypothetical protein [Deltaproteobacteria bacterium]